jgi:hypothetical protein
MGNNASIFRHFPRKRESMLILLSTRNEKWIDLPVPRLALRAIRYANVRSGILPPQSACAGITPLGWVDFPVGRALHTAGLREEPLAR